jgi:hypothetical protein
MKAPASALLLLFGLASAANAQAMENADPNARGWAEGLLTGYLQGKQPPPAVLCPVTNADDLMKQLSYFRRGNTSDFQTLRVQATKDLREVLVMLKAKATQQQGVLTLEKRGSTYCLRDAMTEERFREVQEEAKKMIREMQADEIYKKK